MTTAVAAVSSALRRRSADAAVRVRYSGPLTTATAAVLEAELGRHVAPRSRVVADLEGVTAIDAGGIATLLVAQQAAETAGGALALRANAIVLRALRASGTIRAFSLWPG